MTEGIGPYTQIPPERVPKLRLLLALAAILLVSGILTPMFTVSQFIVISTSFSVFSGVLELFRNGQYLLFLVVSGFSLVLPLLKLFVLYRLITPDPQHNRKLTPLLKLMHEYGRWAMLDLMVVAILIVVVKLGTIASIQIHYGLYIFTASILLIMFITRAVVKLTDRPSTRE
jgi:paraquat-inducible protein A